MREDTMNLKRLHDLLVPRHRLATLIGVTFIIFCLFFCDSPAFAMINLSQVKVLHSSIQTRQSIPLIIIKPTPTPLQNPTPSIPVSWQLLNINSSLFFQTVLGASSSLMAISVTLVALVIALIEIARNREGNYLRTARSREKIKLGLERLRFTIWAYGGAMILSTIGLLFATIEFVFALVLAIAIASLFLIGTGLLIRVSYMLTSVALEVL